MPKPNKGMLAAMTIKKTEFGAKYCSKCGKQVYPKNLCICKDKKRNLGH